MKKMFVAFGIAIALFCGFSIAGMSATQVEAESIETPVSIEEAIDNYHENTYFMEHDIDNIEVISIKPNEDYAGDYEVFYRYTDANGRGWYSSIGMGSLGPIEF